MSFDMETFLPYRLYQAAEMTGRAFEREYGARYGLRRTEWRVLFNVGQYGPISAVEISRRASLEKTKISRAVHRLQERGWLKRLYSKGNRRTHDLELTGDGRRIFQELTLMASEFNARFEDKIGQNELDKLITQLNDLQLLDHSTPAM